jgi:H+/Cl- antiporter ClcA
MLPLDQPWYRRLIFYAFGLGLVAGLLGLGYLAVTGTGIDRLFGDPTTEMWSGEWWWIPFVAVGGITVAVLRKVWATPDVAPGAIDAIESAVVDHKSAPQLVAISAVSLIFGASLGPSFALVIMGGAFGSWWAERKWAEGKADETYTLAGMAGGLGGAFTAPILGAFLVSELAPTPRERYVASIIPQLISATVGFMVFYVIIGQVFIRSFELPKYDFEMSHMVVAVGLGFAAVVVVLTMVALTAAVKKASGLVSNRFVLGGVGGAFVGLTAYAMPLTLGSGNAQLAAVLENPVPLGIGLLVAVLVAKMVAVVVSMSIGFIGGNVFPMIFIGGTAGVVIHLIFPSIPIALAVSAMMAAVPGSFLRAPVSLTFLAALSIGLGPETTAPVVVSVITAYLLVATIRYFVALRKKAAAPGDALPVES